MRRFLQWASLFVGIAACIAICYAAYQLAGYSWAQVVGYRSPYLQTVRGDESAADVGVTPAQTPPYDVPPALSFSAQHPAAPVTARVVLVIVDGLREDVSRSAMQYLDNLRGYGGDYVLTVPQPSLSYPNWTTILTGATQDISGVTTNWYDGRVRAPTIMDAARSENLTVAVVGPTDFEHLYGLGESPLTSLRPWPKSGFLTPALVNDALRISAAEKPGLLVLHLPDLDEAGHDYGGASTQYRDVARKIDVEIQRLVSSLPTDTTIMITADHGHIDSGGHGGWESVATHVPLVIEGPGSTLFSGTGELSQVAPTVSLFLGAPVPPFAVGTALRDGIAAPAVAYANGAQHHDAFLAHYATVVNSSSPDAATWLADARRAGTDVEVAAAQTRDARIAREQQARLPYAGVLALAALLLLAFIGALSWRALVATLAGCVGYYGVYNLLFFTVHGYQWSLSAFNKDTQVKAFMNGRLLEAALAGVVAAAIAALVYPLLRQEPKGPQNREFRPGWLALGPATVLAIQATLAVQVAWFIWAYGASVTWILPNFYWGFKYDLDLVQATGLAAAAVVAPLVTYLVGRYHPRMLKVGRATRSASSKT